MKRYKVYCLRNKEQEIKYVGQTRQTLQKRLAGHREKSWFKDEYFTIELIADFDIPEPMFQLEAMLIQQYDLVNKGWNKAFGYENGKQDFDASKSNNGFYGHKHTKDICNKIGERSVGNQYAKGNKSRSGRNNTEEHKLAISEKVSRRVICLETGEVFKSGRDAASKLGLCRSKVSNVCHGKRKTTGGYHFKFVEEMGG